MFRARLGVTFQNHVIFAPGTLLVTFRKHFAPSAEFLRILILKMLGSIQIHENERIGKRFASWKRSEPYAKTAKFVEIRQNRRKFSMSTLQKSSKNRVSSTSRWYFPKSCDFHARIAFGHVPVTLCPKRRNFVDFHPKIARIHPNPRK